MDKHAENGRRRFLRALALTAGAGVFAAAGYGAQHTARAAEAKKPPPVGQRVMYTCPMHPQILQDHPGNCPICNMTLVKVAGNGGGQHAMAEAVQVDPAAQQRIGLQLVTAATADIADTVRAFATISADESRLVSVNPKVEGWLRKVNITGVGQPVQRGQVLYEIYSPELQQRQREYIDLLTRKDGLLGDSMTVVSSNSAMVGSLAKEKFRARARLAAADMSDALIDELEKSRRVQDVVAVRAEHDGTVIISNMHEGNYVNPMQQICAYADLAKVWADVSLFPDQLSRLKNGDRASLRAGAGSTVERVTVSLASVQVDPATRTARLRLPVRNERGNFKPGMFAEVEIAASSRRALQIPRDALIRTGHGDFVVVAEANHHFRRAQVTAGIETQDNVAITTGLREGDRVVANGQFLLDGAASMQALQARLASQL